MIRRPWPIPPTRLRRRAKSAIATIDSTVQAVKDKADAAASELPSTGTPEGTTEETGKDSTGETPTGTVSEEPAAKATVKGA